MTSILLFRLKNLTTTVKSLWVGLPHTACPDSTSQRTSELSSAPPRDAKNLPVGRMLGEGRPRTLQKEKAGLRVLACRRS